MRKFERLSPSERKKQIREATIQIISKIGIRNCTMEKIIKATGMSKGGVYHYYSNLSDIIYDIVRESMEFRFLIIQKSLNQYQGLSKTETFVEMTIDKMIDENPYKKLYANILLEAQSDKKIRKMLDKIFQDGSHYFVQLISEMGYGEYSIFKANEFIHFINAIIFATEMLGSKDIFEKNRNMLRVMIKAYVNQLLKEKTD